MLIGAVSVTGLVAVITTVYMVVKKRASEVPTFIIAQFVLVHIYWSAFLYYEICGDKWEDAHSKEYQYYNIVASVADACFVV